MRAGSTLPLKNVLRWSLWTIAVLVALAFAIPNYVKSRVTTSMNSCVFNQMWLEAAKRELIRKQPLGTDSILTRAALMEQLTQLSPMWDGRDARVPVSPTTNRFYCLFGDELLIGDATQPVSCPRGKDGLHGWTAQDFDRHYALKRR